MPDPRPAPDESSGVPRCVRECPHYSSDDYGEECSAPGHPVVTESGRSCLPRIRELVALSRRRCDGCPRYVEDARAYPSDGRCSKRGCTTMAHDCCSRWEAKR